MPTLLADGTSGVVCIYNGADDVVANPNADLSRVLFHSSLLYPTVISQQSGSTTLPAVGEKQSVNTTYTLFNHGTAGTPFVLGYISNLAAVNVALAGSVPTDMGADGFSRWVTLGADNTRVYLHLQTVTRSGVSFGSRSLNWVVYVTDLIL